MVAHGKLSREEALALVEELEAVYGRGRTALRHSNPFQLLVAVILSAQCTDKRVNQVAPRLFRRFPGPREMAQADLAELEEIIRPVGCFRVKARHIRETARMVVEEFGGRVPDTMEELTRLPGVARKTANVVLYSAFGKNEGIAVDTHVRRISRRLGLTTHTDPAKIEQDLMALVPRERWGNLTFVMIDHGRAVCRARRPLCHVCPVADRCPSSALLAPEGCQLQGD